MIDFKKELQNYPPVDLNRLLETNPDIPDNVRNSIVLYNKALENFRTKSEDIAIIELRKAISLNPDFYEASNLLGVFYIYTGENKKAEEVLKKVVEAERNSVLALEYLKEINPEYDASGAKQSKDRKQKTENIKTAKSSEKRKKETNKVNNYSLKDSGNPPIKRKSNLNGVIRNSIGFLLGALLVFIVVMIMYFADNKTVDPVKKAEPQNTAAANEYNNHQKELEELEQAYLEASNSLKEASSKLSYYTSVAKLLEIEKLVSEKSYESAADLLLQLKNIEFKGIEKEKYEKLLKDSISNAAGNVFSEGRKLLEAKKYQEALDYFNKAASYEVSGWKYQSVNLYYQGYCYKELNNITMATKIFNEVIEKFPSSSYANYSKTRLKEIEKTP
ncbi:MAG: tetratricopeptide repeat protein [Clostridiaceae bacterium]|nr:tetratricopeptide repeat protein [Clostridiaceae bacterium]